MKLAFSTLGCPGWSFEKVLDEAQRLGFTGIEIRAIEGEMRAEKIPAFFPVNAEKTNAMLKERGLTLVGFGTGVKFHDSALFEDALEEGRQAIDVCARMGIPRIRVFGDKITDDKEATIQSVAKGLRILCDYANGKGVDVLLEIHGDFDRLETVMPVIEKVKDCPAFGILWDIEHSFKVYKDSWRVFYEGIKPWIRHTHFKDIALNDNGFTICLPGEGDIPMGDIYKTLKADGYTGWYSLEWEKYWHPELPDPEVAFPCYVSHMMKHKD